MRKICTYVRTKTGGVISLANTNIG